MQTHWCAVEKTKNAKKICDEMLKIYLMQCEQAYELLVQWFPTGAP